jgi:predicted negative regulator of RcsB-dependent stress response
VEAYRTEEEQIEAIKNWWNDNGKGIVAAVVVGVVASVGWQWWQGSQVDKSERASLVYNELIELSANSELSPAQQVRVDELAATLKEDFGGTGYAKLADLVIAAELVERGEAERAYATLEALENDVASDPTLYGLVKLRRARLQATVNDAQSALATLETLVQGEYAALARMAMSDIELNEGNYESALTQLNLALALNEDLTRTPEIQDRVAYLESRISSASDADGEAQ